MDRLDDYAAALEIYEQFREQRRAGGHIDADAWLAQHADLRDILEPFLHDDVAPTDTGSTLSAPPSWLGLPEAGQQFGSYRIERLLGQGGMGAVFLARDQRLERAVALKLIRPERLAFGAAAQRFWREAKLVAKLDHPGICPIYEVGEVAGMPFMAMRYLEGETLAQRLAATTTAPSNAEVRARLDIVASVARALHWAHERGIVHRDVKPGNIVLTADGPLLLDFGVARDDDSAAHGLTMTGDLTGTPLYMSPEQVAPDGRVSDRTADVFALGAMLHEAVSGQRAFDGASMRELFEAILRHDPPPASRLNANVPRDVDTVIAKAVDKDRQRRYRTAEELADELERVLRNEPVRARRAGWLSRGRRWVQRNPRTAKFVAALIVALLALGYKQRQLLQARSDFDLVARDVTLRDLLSKEATLYDEWPAHGEALRDWLRTAEDFAGALPQLREVSARLQDASSESDRFLQRTLADLLPEAERFVDPVLGDLARIRNHAAWSERVRSETIDTHAADWQRAAAAIRADPRFAGLELRPQVGLVPLAADPVTGLQEFYLPRSGEPPLRDGERWRIDEATGIVFVLLPPATFVMGARDDDADGGREERPLHPVQLDAFFLSKYPMTQAQWCRLHPGPNPSGWPQGSKARGSGEILATWTHPVENVSWHDADATLRWFGLQLPTEAQWEYACRAGTETPWWTGPTKDTLSHKANIADKKARDMNANWSDIDESIDDGYALHAPVDSLGANAFGLYHMHGNVWEWCADWLGDYTLPTRAGDGLRQVAEQNGKVKLFRGGSYDYGSKHARSAMRRQAAPEAHTNNVGVRPARRIR